MFDFFHESPLRMCRRVAGHFLTAISALLLLFVRDPRRGKTTWPLATLLKALLMGLAAGAKGLQDVEMQTFLLAPAARKLFGIRKRMPDTTLRDILMKLDVNDLRRLNHRFMRAAEYRKQARHTLPLRPSTRLRWTGNTLHPPRGFSTGPMRP